MVPRDWSGLRLRVLILIAHWLKLLLHHFIALIGWVGYINSRRIFLFFKFINLAPELVESIDADFCQNPNG